MEVKKVSFEKYPLVSIIIPTYNRAYLIGETIESILSQTYKNWECIIVDDGSTDSTNQVIQKYITLDNRIRFYNRPDDLPKGANSCRNYGFQLSEGEYIQWFDSDDLMIHNLLEDKIKLFKNDLTLDFVACSLSFFKHDENSFNRKVLYSRKTIFNKDPFSKFLLGELTLRICSPLWKKSFLVDKKLFDLKLKRAQEWEFYGRLLSHQPKYESIDDVLINIRYHEDNISSNFHKGDSDKIISDYLARKLIFNLARDKGKLNDEIRIVFVNYIFSLLKLSVSYCSLKINLKIILFYIEIEMSFSKIRYCKIFKIIIVILSMIILKRGHSYLKN